MVGSTTWIGSVITQIGVPYITAHLGFSQINMVFFCSKNLIWPPMCVCFDRAN